MNKIYKLFVNEMLKIFSRKSNYIMIASVVVITIGFGILSVAVPRNISNNQLDNWREEYERNIQFLKEELENNTDGSDRPKQDKYHIQNSINELQYKLDNNIAPDSWKNQLVEELFYSIYPEIDALSAVPGNEERIAQLKAQAEEIEKVIKEDETKGDAWKSYIEKRKKAVLEDESLNKESKDILIYEYDMMLKYDIKPRNNRWGSSSDWKRSSLDQIINAREQLKIYQNYDPGNDKGGALNLTEEELKEQIDSAIEVITVNEYRIKNNNAPYSFSSMMGFMETSSGLINFISMLVLIIVGSIAASEYSTGTIKLLLISPNKRWKIWLAKFLASCMVAVILLVTLYITSALTGMIVGSKEDSGVRNYIYYLGDGKIMEINFFAYIAIRYLNGAITLLVMASLAYMLSILFRNSAVAIGVGIFLLLAGSVINTVLTYQLKLDWAKYLIFANMNMNRFFDTSVVQGIGGMAQTSGLSYVGSLVVLAVHMIVFLAISNIAFTRTDIK